MKSQSIRWTCLFLAVSVLAALAAAAVAEETSETNPRLKRWLERYPDADADKDGVLTMSEARAYRQKLAEGRRRGGAQGQGVNPTFANVRYGPHKRNVLDFWQAKAEAPTPVLVCFHGGGFVGGDKSRYAGGPARVLPTQGISVVSANYRFVRGPGAAPFPAPMHDGARVVQFLRHKAKEWNLDPDRIALMGGSAGACMSIWIALHDDLADPKSNDPVARQSTRVSCVVSFGGQTFLDPRLILKHIGGNPTIHPSALPFYGAQSMTDFDKPEFRRLIEEATALNHASKDDPPIMLLYGQRIDDVPLPKTASTSTSIHHPMFGKVLKDKLDALGVECHLHYKGKPDPRPDYREFIRKHLKPEKDG